MDSFVTSAPMQNGNTNHAGGDGIPLPATTKGKPKGLIEKTYQKKSQLEHILLRPDTYIGESDFHLNPCFHSTKFDYIVFFGCRFR